MATKTEKTKQGEPVRHGDLVLHPIPKTKTTGMKTVKGNALATGTATGHSHRFVPAANAKLYDDGKGNVVLRVAKAVRLVHQEHADIRLTQGDYRVVHMIQYDREHGWAPVAD